MRIFPILAFSMIAAGAFSCSGADSSLKVTIPHNELNQTAVVRVDKGNLRIEKRISTPDQKKKKTDSVTTATRLGEPEMDIHWTPAWNVAGSGSLRLLNTATSPDNTAMICLEETGDALKGPHGGRLILLDLPGKRIIRVLEIGRRIIRAQIAPDHLKAICFAEAQPVLNQPSGFVVIDLKTGAEEGFYPAKKPFSYVFLNGKIYFSTAGSNEISVISTEDAGRKKIRSGESALLEISDNRKLLIAASEDAIRFLDPETGKPMRSVSLPPGNKPYRLTAAGSPDGATLFFSSKTEMGKGKLFLISGESVKEITNETSGELAYNPKDKTLFCGSFLRNRIRKLDPYSFEEISYCDPKTQRPMSSGSNRELFCGSEPGEIIVQDTRGALYSLKSIRKRWQKTMIVESGMR